MSGMGLLLGCDAAPPAGGGHQSTRSLSFNGSTGYVTTGLGAITGDLTISLWIKPSSIGSSVGLVGRSQTSDTTVGFLVWLKSTGEVQMFAGNGSSAFRATTTTQLVAGTWYHILAVISGTTMQVYLNGTVDGGSTTFSGSRQVGQGFAFGVYDLTPELFYAGLMDDLAVWASDQSAHAAGLAAGSTDPSTLAPDGLWRMEEGSGTTTADSSGNGNTGTFHGGVTWSSDVPSQLA